MLLLRLVLVALLIRGVLKLWRGIAAGLREPAAVRPKAVPLARDPVCGTYVVPARALTAGAGGDMRFFCSEKCRRTYVTANRQASAGGQPPQAAASAQRDGERQRDPIERSN